MPHDFQQSQPYLPHAPCPDVSVLGAQVASIMEWRKEASGKLDQLLSDGSRVRLLEHQMLQLNNTMERLTEVIERIEQRLVMLERDGTGNARVRGWVDKGIWATLGLVAAYVAKKVGLL